MLHPYICLQSDCCHSHKYKYPSELHNAHAFPFACWNFGLTKPSKLWGSSTVYTTFTGRIGISRVQRVRPKVSLLRLCCAIHTWKYVCITYRTMEAYHSLELQYWPVSRVPQPLPHAGVYRHGPSRTQPPASTKRHTRRWFGNIPHRGRHWTFIMLRPSKWDRDTFSGVLLRRAT